MLQQGCHAASEQDEDIDLFGLKAHLFQRPPRRFKRQAMAVITKIVDCRTVRQVEKHGFLFLTEQAQ
ncbi:hypothetical protein [Tumebacillus lipolyticus]|uniref:Uncharacterized protein n=1 Tax=Tumebacillus lipolyticus TaxID=1280370 RepID=A0ABW4ZSA3_9BACL